MKQDSDFSRAPGAAWRNWRRRPMLLAQAACVFSFLLWAALFDLEVASYAQGQVIPAGQVKRIQHLEGGIVKEIKVAEGQYVKAGSVIAEMEGLSSNADVSELKIREINLEGKTRRLNAILNKAAAPDLPKELFKDYPKVQDDARSAFQAYQARYAAMLKTQESKVSQRRTEIVETRERLSGLQARSKLIAEQVKISERMLQQKLTNEYEHLQLLKEQAQVVSDRDTAGATLQRLGTALEEAGSSLNAFRSEEDVSLRKELLEANTELTSLKERLRKPSDSFERTAIRTPTAGTVMTLFIKSKGAVVAPGGLVATIVPDGESLLIEAKLPIADIGFVRMGAPAKLALSGGTGGFSSIDAEVAYISPDATLDEKTGSSHYLIRLRPQQLSFLRGGEHYPLKPGVQVMATILIGERAVLALLLDTFFGSNIKPLREK